MDTNNRQSLKEAGNCYDVEPETSTNRNLLCYWHGGATNNSLLHQLEDAGWNVLPAHDSNKVKTLANNHPVTVGVIFIDNHESGESLDNICDAISSVNDITWFTLLNSRCRMGDAVCSLTANYCADFFTPLMIRNVSLRRWGMATA